MAAEDIGALVVRIEANLKNFNDGVNDVNEKVDKMGSGLKKFAGIVAGAFAFDAVVSFGKKLITTASDAAEMQSKFNTVFSNMSKDAEAWSTDFQKRVGGSRVEIKGMIADSQDMLTGFGANTNEAFKLSTQMQSLGTDLASFQNVQGGATEAVDRVRKGLLGEHENLKALGIVINETVIAQEMAARGDNRKFQSLTELEKIELRYAIAVKQSKNAIGDAEKTADGFANQMRNLKGQIVDASARLGENLLPKATEFVSFLVTKMPDIEKFINNGINALGVAFGFVSDNADILIPIITGLTAAIVAQSIIGNVTKLYKAWQLATTAQTTAQWLLNIALNANPLGVVAIAIGVLIAAGVALYRNWDKVTAYARALWAAIKTNFSNISEKIGGVWDGVKEKTSSVWVGITETIANAVNSASSKINKLIDLINNIPGVDIGKIPRIDTSDTNDRIPAFAKGTNYVPFDTKAFIHQGEAIIPADNNPSNPRANNPIGQAINYDGMFNGATFNVRSDNDAKLIARETFNLQQAKARGLGVVYE